MIRNTGCCGIKEIDGLRNEPISNLEQVVLARSGDGFCTILFSDVPDYGKGRDFAQFIKANKLGDLVKMDEVLNPNSDNMIEAWLFTFDTDAIFDCYNKHTGEDYKPYERELDIW